MGRGPRERGRPRHRHTIQARAGARGGDTHGDRTHRRGVPATRARAAAHRGRRRGDDRRGGRRRGPPGSHHARGRVDQRRRPGQRPRGRGEDPGRVRGGDDVRAGADPGGTGQVHEPGGGVQARAGDGVHARDAQDQGRGGDPGKGRGRVAANQAQDPDGVGAIQAEGAKANGAAAAGGVPDVVQQRQLRASGRGRGRAEAVAARRAGSLRRLVLRRRQPRAVSGEEQRAGQLAGVGVPARVLLGD